MLPLMQVQVTIRLFGILPAPNSFKLKRLIEVESLSPRMHGIANGIVFGNGLDLIELKLSFVFVLTAASYKC